ncbi:MAG TPA: hypothetical protein VK158_02700 [Acidobacteriota bacterium]|nr:hypothetical protein [Acidobacteriota bacterium]
MHTFVTRAILTAACLGTTACSTVVRTAVDYCDLRRMETQIPLEQRVQLVEDRLFSEFYYPDIGLISHYNERKDEQTQKGPLQLEQNAHLLVALAKKYEVTKDEQTLARAKKLIDGFLYMDKLNDLDGFLPMEVRLQNDKTYLLKPNTPSFGYTQLFYAYVLAKESFANTSVSENIAFHANLIFERLAKDNFIVKNNKGKQVEYSDASPTKTFMLTSSHIESLAFATAGRYLVDKYTNPGLHEKLKSVEHTLRVTYGYDTRPALLKVNLGIYRVPTPSTSWLDLMKLAIIYHTTKHEKYAKHIVDLAKSYADDKNPFFITMHLQHGNESMQEKKKLAQIALERLQTYPITNTSQEVINSTGASTRLIPRFVKNQAEKETTQPLPIWATSGDTYQWKRNPYRIQGNIGEDGSKIFNAVDLYEVYWMLQSQTRTRTESVATTTSERKTAL